MPSTDCKPSGQLGVGIVVVAARVVVSATTVVSATIVVSAATVVVSATTVVSTTVDVADVVSATVVPITVDVADVVVDEYASLSSIVMGVGEMAVGLADGLLEVGFSVRISVVMAEIVVAIGVVSTTVVSTSVSDVPSMRLSSATVLLSSPSSCEGARG